MKKEFLLPAAAVGGGAAVLVLRLLQNRTGFEPDTGLPIAGNPLHIAIPVLLAVLAVVLVLLCRRLPSETEEPPAFPQAFSTPGTGLLTLTVTGVFLMAASGVLDLLTGLGFGLPAADADYALTASGLLALSGVTPRESLLMGLTALVSAVCLFPAAAACRSREGTSKSCSGTLLLAPPVCLVVRLVLVYRTDSINPTLASYYMELLALVLMTMGLYRLSSFAFKAGRTRRFAFYSSAAAALCIAAPADGLGLSSLLLCAGGGLTLLGFLLQRLSQLSTPAAED